MKEQLSVLQELIHNGLDLDSFYSVSFDRNGTITLQGYMKYDTIQLFGKNYGVVFKSETDSGFIRGFFEFDETRVRIALS